MGGAHCAAYKLLKSKKNCAIPDIRTPPRMCVWHGCKTIHKQWDSESLSLRHPLLMHVTDGQTDRWTDG